MVLSALSAGKEGGETALHGVKTAHRAPVQQQPGDLAAAPYCCCRCRRRLAHSLAHSCGAASPIVQRLVGQRCAARGSMRWCSEQESESIAGSSNCRTPQQLQPQRQPRHGKRSPSAAATCRGSGGEAPAGRAWLALDCWGAGRFLGTSTSAGTRGSQHLPSRARRVCVPAPALSEQLLTLAEGG